MNKIIVIGNVGRDPEMRYTPNGNGVTSFSIASNRRYKTSSGEQRDETEWFNVSAWGKLADLCNQYLVKGKQVYLEGTLSSQRWEGQDGERRFSNNINLREIQFLDRSQNAADGSGTQGGEPMDEEPDLPF